MDIIAMQERKSDEIDSVVGYRPNRLSTRDLLRLFGPLEIDPETGEIIADGDEEPFIFTEDAAEAIEGDSDTEQVPRTIPPRPF